MLLLTLMDEKYIYGGETIVNDEHYYKIKMYLDKHSDLFEQLNDFYEDSQSDSIDWDTPENSKSDESNEFNEHENNENNKNDGNEMYVFAKPIMAVVQTEDEYDVNFNPFNKNVVQIFDVDFYDHFIGITNIYDEYPLDECPIYEFDFVSTRPLVPLKQNFKQFIFSNLVKFAENPQFLKLKDNINLAISELDVFSNVLQDLSYKMLTIKNTEICDNELWNIKTNHTLFISGFGDAHLYDVNQNLIAGYPKY